jgi:hypothetical protein
MIDAGSPRLPQGGTAAASSAKGASITPSSASCRKREQATTLERRMSRVTAAALSIAIVSVIGCGGGSSRGSDEDEVRSVVHAEATALAQRDYGRACSLLSAARRRRTGRGRVRTP